MTQTITINVENARGTLRGLMLEHQHPYAAALYVHLDDPTRGGENLILGTIAALVMENARLVAEVARLTERNAAPAIVTHVES